MPSIYKTDNKLFTCSLSEWSIDDWFQYTLLKTLYNFANWLFVLQFTITNDSHCDTSKFYSKNTRTHNFSFSMFNWSKTLLQTCKGQKINKVCIYVVSADFFQRAQEKKKGVVNLLLCTIVDRKFVIHAYFLLTFIYSCIIDTFHLRWLIIRWRGSYKSSSIKNMHGWQISCQL
jgi:hypothetical protein